MMMTPIGRSCVCRTMTSSEVFC